MTATLPHKYLFRMRELLGNQYESYMAAMEEEPRRAAHINLCKGNGRASLPCTAVPMAWYAEGMLCKDAEHIGTSAQHHAGMFYMQEPSAMAPVCALPIEPGMKVLDMCSAPGGKASQAANRLKNTGELVANEYVQKRVKILASNMERMGVRHCAVISCDTAQIAEAMPLYFDRVIVDAPCSGEGMFRKDPEAVAQWSEELVHSCAELQQKILDNADAALCPGGMMVYSTCTFSPEENEKNIDAFLNRHPEYSLCPVSEEIQSISCPGINFPGLTHDMTRTRRLYPHVCGGEGQYLAVLQKSGEAPKAPEGTKRKKVKRVDSRRPSDVFDRSEALPDKKAALLAERFLGEVLDTDVLPSVYRFKDGLVLDPPELPLPPARIYIAGVKLGEIRGNRIVPHHGFFSAYGDMFKRKIDFEPQTPALQAYLRGETFATDCADGWAVVTVDGYPLGGVKVSGGVAKNHYPTGLRNKI